MPKKEISDKIANAMAVIFEEFTGDKYKVVREGHVIRIEPDVEDESARADTEQAAQTTLDGSDIGQSPEEDTDEPFTGKTALREDIKKFKTAKGWYLKVIDDEGRVDEDGTKWLCSDLVKWIQGLPKHVSTRSPDDNRDRAYPARGGGGIYVNDAEMLLLEEIAKEREIVIEEREFDKQ